MDFLLPLLQNPMVLGAVLTSVMKSVQGLLEKVDNQKLLEPYVKHLHPVFLVMAFLTSALDLGLQGKVHELNLDAVVQFLQVYIPLLLGGKAMDVTLKNSK